MARPKFVQIPAHRLDRFRPLLGDRYEEVEAAATAARERFSGRAIWHVSSTLRGGGVAEMLRALLPYARGAGVDSRWVVLREGQRFFTLTKRLHNNLHGQRGDGGPLGPAEHRVYEEALAASARHVLPLLRPRDVVFLHDPQTAGLAPAMRAAGARVIWRCHIGADRPNETVRAAWEFLAPYLAAADAYVFSRQAYFWSVLDADRSHVMAPSIDPFAPKNQDLAPETVAAIVAAIGLGPALPGAAPAFTRADGTPGRIERRAEVLQERPLPPDAPLTMQLSRWDRLKDHAGLLRCFAERLADGRRQLLLAGPASAAVADDPEGAAVWAELVAAWRGLPDAVRGDVHLVSLPLDDLDENGAMVNALQRRADVVVQKSLAEGFGLTVAEAMWKRRPVVGSRVGGIQDQIVAGESGLLVDDPRDLEAFAAAIGSLLDDPARAAAIGERARERVRENYLAAIRLVEYARLAAAVDESHGAAAAA